MTRVELFGQPIVRASLDGSLIGTEVLFRMNSGVPGGAISPDAYLGAMPGGQMAWFMDATVMGILMAGETAAVREKLFINVCPETLLLPYAFSAWLAAVTELCERRGPGRVVVEIPEQVPLTPRVIATVRAIAAKGALLALDDYPGGNLDHRYLRAYQWDYVKVCRAACSTAGRDPLGVVHEVQRLCPKALIIGERFSPSQSDLASVIHNIDGLQSFETGVPSPLMLGMPVAGGGITELSQDAFPIMAAG